MDEVDYKKILDYAACVISRVLAKRGLGLTAKYVDGPTKFGICICRDANADERILNDLISASSAEKCYKIMHEHALRGAYSLHIFNDLFKLSPEELLIIADLDVE